MGSLTKNRKIEGSLESCTINYPTPRQFANNTMPYPSLLTAEDTVNYTVEVTVSQSDLPTFSSPRIKSSYTAYLYVWGAGASGAPSTVNYRFLKNGSNIVQTSAAVPSGQYYTLLCTRFPLVVVGDKLQCRLWCATGGVYIGYCLIVLPTRIFPVPSGSVLTDVGYSVGAYPKDITVKNALASPIVGQTATNFGVYEVTQDLNLTVRGTTATWTEPIIVPQSYGVMRQNYGDVNTTSNTASNHASNCPYWYKPWVLTKLSWRRTKLFAG